MAQKIATELDGFECVWCGWRFGSRWERLVHRFRTLGRW